MNNYPQYQQNYQQNYQQGYQPDMQQVSNEYNNIMRQMQGQMQGLNDRMAQIQNQFQQQYPQLFQQPPQQQMQPQQPQQMQTDIVGIAPVTSMDEVKAQTPSPVGKKLFTNFKQGEVSFVYFDNDGNKVIDVYSKKNINESENVEQTEFATIKDINFLFDYIKSLEEQIKIGGVNNDTRPDNANYTEPSSNSGNVPKTSNQSKSNTRYTNDGTAE